MLGGDGVGDAGLSGVKGDAAVETSFAPPSVEVDELVRLARRVKQHFPGFLVAIFAPEPLDAVVQKPNVALRRARGQRIKQLSRIRTALDYGDARRDLLLLGRRKQLCGPQRHIGGGRAVWKQQLVDAGLMILRAQHRAEAVQDLLLHRQIQLIIAPGRDHELARCRLVAFLQIGAGEGGLAGAGKRRQIGEEGPDLVRACIAQEESDFGALAELVLARPIGIGEAEALDRLRGRIEVAVPVVEPGGKLAGCQVLDSRRRVGSSVVACQTLAERALEVGHVGSTELISQ